MILELLVAAAVEASKKQLEKGSRVRLDLHLSNNPIKTRVNITYSIISSEREGKAKPNHVHPNPSLIYIFNQQHFSFKTYPTTKFN